MRHRKWSLEEIKEIAKTASSRSDFKRIAAGAYDRAKRMGWLNEVCAHMIPMTKSRGYWNQKEKVVAEARKYTMRSDFYFCSAGAYKAAISNGWLDEVCRHMGEPHIEGKIFSREDVFAEAKKYKRRSEFSKISRKAYSIARENGWLDECCSHMKKYSKDLTIEEVLKIAKQFQSRTEFFNNSPAVHNIAKQNGWFEEVCKHMKTRYRGLTREQVFEEARKYQTRTDFYENSRSHYRVASKYKWLDECCVHMVRPAGRRKKIVGPDGFTKILSEAKKYASFKEFKKNSPREYIAARKLGFIDEIRDFMSMD